MTEQLYYFIIWGFFIRTFYVHKDKMLRKTCYIWICETNIWLHML